MGADRLGLSIAALIAFGGTWLVAELVRRRAHSFGLIDAPNQRSSHVRPTPLGGGAGIVVAAVAAGIWLAMRRHVDPMLARLIGLSLVIAGVGLRDDIRPLPAAFRFSVQIAVCTLMVMSWPATMSDVVLVGAGVWWINAFNFMDGIDGIAGAEGAFVLTAAAMLAAMANPELVALPSWMWTIAVVAALLGFLKLNWPPARIFMGDVGSTWLAFVIFGLALLTVHSGSLTWPVWLIVTASFLADATVTLLRRLSTGQRWFEAHRSHAYQRLARRWRSHRAVTVLILGVDLLWLLPIAAAAARWRTWGWDCAVLAYAPLIGIILGLRAGMPDGPCAQDAVSESSGV